MKNKPADIVFNILQQMLAHSPEASFQRLNPALRCTLGDCISADLPFQPDTFSRIFNELRGGWWFGDGAGSSPGEHYYAQAIKVNHATAYQSFEQFAGRPGVLWEQDANIPVRLHVGAKFTWKGHYVTITSMRADSLVACTYHDTRSRHGIKVGATIDDYQNRQNKHYVITNVRPAGKNAHFLRVIKAKPTFGESDVAKRFTIPYSEIAEFRRTEKARLKKIIAKIATCNPKTDAVRLTKEISAEHFRHFQLEEINAAFKKRKDWFANEARIEAWRKGSGDAWLDVKNTLLRVKGQRVECSNGNCVSLAAARRVLPVLIDRRTQPGSVNLPLDGHTVKSIDGKGVTIGCTFVDWSEVELLNTALKI